jgi:hypothetical protein
MAKNGIRLAHAQSAEMNYQMAFQDFRDCMKFGHTSQNKLSAGFPILQCIMCTAQAKAENGHNRILASMKKLRI